MADPGGKFRLISAPLPGIPPSLSFQTLRSADSSMMYDFPLADGKLRVIRSLAPDGLRVVFILIPKGTLTRFSGTLPGSLGLDPAVTS